VVKNVCFKAYIEWLKFLGQKEGVHYSVNLSDLVVRHFFGHTVYFKTAEAWKTFVGANLSHYTFDEPGRAPEEAHREVNERLRCPKAKVPHQALYVGTPQGRTFYMDVFSGAEFEDIAPKLRVGDREYHILEEAKNKLVLHSPTFWNNHLSESFLESLLDVYGHSQQLIDAHIFGQFVALFENNAYEFDESKHVRPCEPDPKNPTIYMGWDFNVGQMAWTAGQLSRGSMWWVRETPAKCTNTDTACQSFVEQFPPSQYGNHEVIVYGDASGWHRDTRGYANDYDIILYKLRAHYPRIRILAPNHNPSVSHRILCVNRALGHNYMYFSPEVRYTIKSMNETAYDGKGGILKPSGDTITHRSDGVGYVTVELFPVIEPTYSGVTWS
jgi:hypothetical protein